MIGNTVSRRYAHALYNIGQSTSSAELERYNQTLGALGSAIESSAALSKIMSNPILSVEEKKNITLRLLSEVGGGDMEKRFCELLADKGRLALLPAIASDYKAMLDDAKGISEGSVTTVVALEDAEKKAILSQLEEKSGRKLELTFEVDPQLLGGVVFQMGDTLFDASLRSQLDNLRESIKRGE